MLGRIIITFVAVGLLDSSHGIVLEGGRNSYARYPPWNGCRDASFSFQFKTIQSGEAVLWYADDLGGSDFFYVSLKDGSVRFMVNVVSYRDYVIEKVLGHNLNDGRWHTVRYQRQGENSIFTVDHMTSQSTFLGNDQEFGNGRYSYVHIGGLPQECATNLFSYSLPSVCLDTRFIGGIRNVVYNNCTCQSTRVAMVDGVAVDNEPIENCDIWNPCSLGCVCLSDERAEPRCDCTLSSCGQNKRDINSHPFPVTVNRTQRAVQDPLEWQRSIISNNSANHLAGLFQILLAMMFIGLIKY